MIFLELSLKKTSRMTKSDICGWQHLRVPKYLLDRTSCAEADGSGAHRDRADSRAQPRRHIQPRFGSVIDNRVSTGFHMITGRLSKPIGSG